MAPNDLEHKIIYFMIIELFCVHLEPIIMTLIGILKFKKLMNWRNSEEIGVLSKLIIFLEMQFKIYKTLQAINITRR